jgi:hypothetical protein
MKKSRTLAPFRVRVCGIDLSLFLRGFLSVRLALENVDQAATEKARCRSWQQSAPSSALDPK